MSRVLAARLFLEGFRGTSALILGGLRSAQVAALGVLLLGLWLMGRWGRAAERSLMEASPVMDRG